MLELSERSEALEETFGVSATAVAAAAPAAVGPHGDSRAAEEESSTVDLILTGSGDQKIQVIKVIHAATGLGLKEAERWSTRLRAPSARGSSARRPRS